MEAEPLNPVQLMVVQGIRSDGGGSTILFTGGKTARLPSFSPDAERRTTLLTRSLERGYPVGVGLGEDGGITGVFRADNDVVAELVEGEEAWVKVLFLGHDGPSAPARRPGIRGGCAGSGTVGAGAGVCLVRRKEASDDFT